MNDARLCFQCFYGCESLSEVKFSDSAILDRIDCGAFCGTLIREIRIPDSVVYLGDRCFSGCRNLEHVIFGTSSSLAHIGSRCFASTGLTELSIPSTVSVIGGGAFTDCSQLSRLDVGDLSPFRVSDRFLFDRSGIRCKSFVGCLRDIVLPSFILELCDRCFYGSTSLNRVTFADPSSLERIGIESFRESHIEHISIPGSVIELCDRCFFGCKNLRNVKFDESSSLRCVGIECFRGSGVCAIIIPDDYVVEVPDYCLLPKAPL